MTGKNKLKFPVLAERISPIHFTIDQVAHKQNYFYFPERLIHIGFFKNLLRDWGSFGFYQCFYLLTRKAKATAHIENHCSQRRHTPMPGLVC